MKLPIACLVWLGWCPGPLEEESAAYLKSLRTMKKQGSLPGICAKGKPCVEGGAVAIPKLSTKGGTKACLAMFRPFYEDSRVLMERFVKLKSKLVGSTASEEEC